MDPFFIGALGLAGLFILILLHVPIGISMAMVGFAGFWGLTGNLSAAASLFGTEAVSAFSSP
ncbi:MAG: TRAP transporter large permease, partial [Alphaproteobacteria bacterium]